MRKKKNAVMLADTRPALVGVVLMQLANTNPGLFDEAIVYYKDEISWDDRKRMERFLPCRFVKYQCPLPVELFEKQRFRLFSPLMFVRYEMPGYLEEFETITWLDTDIYIQGDLRGLLDTAKKTGAALVREDPVHKTAEKPDRMRTCFTEEISGYRLNEYLYCSGTIVLTSQCATNFSGLTQWCYDKTCEWADILSLPDQGVLNAAIQEYQIEVTPLTGKIYCCYPYRNRDCSDATIIHAWGLNKFWNDWYLYRTYDCWAKMYEQWISDGGTPLPFRIQPQVSVVIPCYKPDLELLKQCLDSLMQQNRDNWERYSDFEIILVAEPYEQEALRNVIESYQDRRIRLIFNEERKGIAASLNRGMKEALGIYIARMDDDDIAADKRLYQQKLYLDTHPQQILCTSDFAYFGDMNEKRIAFEGELCRAWSIFTCPFDHPTVMFRKEFFVENQLYYDEKRGFVEDWELWQRAFENGMTVGCVHEVLLYHRWMHKASAGQSSQTVVMMQEMIQKNFLKLGIEIEKEDLPYIAPWNGKITDQKTAERVEGYFQAALEQNRTMQIYCQDSLKRVFFLRMEEIRTGELPGLVQKETEKETQRMISQKEYSCSPLKLWVKRLLRPLYLPIKYRYEEKIKLLVQKALENEGHIMDSIYKLDVLKEMVMEVTDAVGMQSDNHKQLLEITMDVCKQQSAGSKMLLEQLERMENSQKQLLDEMAAQQMQQRMIESVKRELEGVYQQNELLHDKIFQLQNEMRYVKELGESELKVKKKILLIGTPEHSNVGDAAIALGEIAFIRRFFGEYHLIELSKYDYKDWNERIAGMIGRDDLIFLQGGGNIGNRYLQEEELRREIIQNFPENQIVVMPQTIWFEQTLEGDLEGRKSAEIYNCHQNLTIFARGNQSLHFAKTYFKQAKAVVMPDMALLLKADFCRQRKGILLCLRDAEDEGIFSKGDKEQIFAMLHEKNLAYDMETNWKENHPNKDIYKDMRRTAVYHKLLNYAVHRAVITDRLHGLIFAVITGTPCVVLSTYNYKIDEVCDLMKKSNAIFFAGTKIGCVDSLLDQALSITDATYPFLEQEHFEKMSKIIRAGGKKHETAN